MMPTMSLQMLLTRVERDMGRETREETERILAGLMADEGNEALARDREARLLVAYADDVVECDARPRRGHA